MDKNRISIRIIQGINILLRVVIVVTMIIFMVQKQYYPVKILAITFVLSFYESLLEKFMKVKLPILIQISLSLFIFAAQYLGTVMDWYGKFIWWDTALHTISGILFFYIGVFLIKNITEKTKSAEQSLLLIVVFAICFSLSIGVVWEIIEFCADTFFGANMQRAIGEVGRGAIMDTMIDLIVATGGTIVGAISYAVVKNKKRSVI